MTAALLFAEPESKSREAVPRTVWVSRDALPGLSNRVTLWEDSPDRYGDVFTGQSLESYLVSFCAKGFSDYFGLDIQPGECREVEVSVNVKQ